MNRTTPTGHGAFLRLLELVKLYDGVTRAVDGAPIGIARGEVVTPSRR